MGRSGKYNFGNKKLTRERGICMNDINEQLVSTKTKPFACRGHYDNDELIKLQQNPLL